MTVQTLYEKLWASHLVHEEPDGTALIYIDRHLVARPQLFVQRLHSHSLFTCVVVHRNLKF